MARLCESYWMVDWSAASKPAIGGDSIWIGALTPDSILRLNDRLPTLLRARENNVELLVPGKVLGFPLACRTALERLRAGPVRYADLALPLSESDRALFVRSLLLEGLVLVDER